MPSFLDNSEASKVDTKELEDHVLAPNEPRVDTDHIARQARGAQHQRWWFQIFSRQGAKEILVQCGKMGRASENAHSFGTEMLGS